MDRQTGGQMGGWVCVCVCVDGWMDGWMYGQMDGWIIPYQNSPMPQVQFLNFQYCEQENFLKLIFFNMGQFSVLYYASES